MAGQAVHRDAATVQVNNLPHDVEAKTRATHPIRLGGAKEFGSIRNSY